MSVVHLVPNLVSQWINGSVYTLHTGFTKGSWSKIQGLFKDFSRLFYNFQGLKVKEIY